PIRDSGELMERVALRQPGDRVSLDVVRYGDQRTLNVTLGAFENAVEVTTAPDEPTSDSVSQLGFAATELTPALANQLGISEPGGLVVTEVAQGGPAPA